MLDRVVCHVELLLPLILTFDEEEEEGQEFGRSKERATREKLCIFVRYGKQSEREKERESM